MQHADRRGGDPLGGALELGLAALLIFAPWPFGAVPPGGRLALELGALLLLLVWLARARSRPTPLPPRAALGGLFGLLALGCVQILPLGERAVRTISPRAHELREAGKPIGAALEAEHRLLGVDPADLDAAVTLALDPQAGASALRTGGALVALLLVATTVASTRGVRRLLVALLLSAAFQGLYGLLVLVSGHDHIWHVPKRYNLDAATGTFVNKNHFACLLAMALCGGAALLLERTRRDRGGEARWFALLGAEGSRTLLLGVLLVVALAGLLTSFSRAGIALGLFGVGLTLLAGGRRHPLRVRVVVAVLVVTAAALPLLQVGSDRLLEHYRRTPEELASEGGRATVWHDTLRLASAFPAVGCGFGSFSAVYPAFRSSEVRKFYAHAHNDLLQAAAEGGLVGVLLLALVLTSLLTVVLRAVGGAKGVLGAGMAIGLAVFGLHSLVDFNAHIPSNAATAAVLAGALWGLPWSNRD